MYSVQYDYQPEYIARRKVYRHEFLRRIGVPINSTQQHLQICNCHGVDRTFVYAEWKNKNRNNRNESDKVVMDVPLNYAVKSSLNPYTNTTMSKGTASARKKNGMLTTLIFDSPRPAHEWKCGECVK